MNPILKQRITTMLLALLCMLFYAFPVFAANLTGSIDSVDATGIEGWAYDRDSTDNVVTIELNIYQDDSTTPCKTVRVTANTYRSDLTASIGDGYHSFSSPINWTEMTGTSFRVEAYAVSDSDRVKLSGDNEYTKPSTIIAVPEAGTPSEMTGPGIAKTTVLVPVEPVKGESLGMFTTTAYCACDKCGSGHNITFSGAIPTAEHTISADLTVFPLGTKLMIDDIIYTVEDKGSSVVGNKLDIFFTTHEEAMEYGRKIKEVFSV